LNHRQQDFAVTSFSSQIPHCAWPAVPSDAGAQALALQFQLQLTEWMSPENIRAAQFEQLQHVLNEAFSNIDYWTNKLTQIGFQPGLPITSEQFSALPVLTRDDLRRLDKSLLNANAPSQHGKVSRGHTSGSTGTPVNFYQTELTQHFWRALTLREHFWQHRDFSASLAAIRSNVETGQASNWGLSTAQILTTGPVFTLNIRADVAEQLNWLVDKNPAYLITHPSNLHALVKLANQRGITLSNLKQLRTFGEVLSDETRELCRRVWDCDIADVYSSEEAGYIALQCDQGAYHVQSENLLVEIVDEDGQPTKPGQVGRVLITTLHNFAMPLIRYDISDYAERGDACPCGRGLPVIRRILGRERNMLKLPDGTEHWPSFPEDRWVGIAPIEQLQVVQKRLDEVVLRVRAERALTENEITRLTDVFKVTLVFPHQVTVEQVASIPRGQNAKFEDFICEVA
jgi:phenylacetate-CoA ligase